MAREVAIGAIEYMLGEIKRMEARKKLLIESIRKASEEFGIQIDYETYEIKAGKF